jgi:hypothetical protein
MKTDRDLLRISLLTFITVIVWVTLELLKTTTTTTVTARTQQLIAPLSSTIDTATLESIQQRKSY